MCALRIEIDCPGEEILRAFPVACKRLSERFQAIRNLGSDAHDTALSPPPTIRDVNFLLIRYFDQSLYKFALLIAHRKGERT